MFRNLIKNKKAQNTAEYALLIALVVAGIIAMQQYAQRALQARVRDASVYMAGQTTALGSSIQYEPYYAASQHVVTRSSEENKAMSVLGTGAAAVWDLGQQAASNRVELGNETTRYTSAGTTVGTGAMPGGI